MVVKCRSKSTLYIAKLQRKDCSLQYGSPKTPRYGDDQLNRRSSHVPHSGSGASRCPRFFSQTGMEIIAPNGVPKTQSRTRIQTSALLLIQIIFFSAIYRSIYSLSIELSDRDSKLEKGRLELENAKDKILQSKADTDSADASLVNFQSQLTDLLPKGQEHITVREGEFDYEAVYQGIVDKNNAMKEKEHKLKNIIADLHRGEALEHFGSSYQHRLVFNLLIDDSMHSFIVEMAPLDLMPHSVNFFLNMVKAQEWDNTIFTHESNRILRAELKDAVGHTKRHFDETLSFTEYNNEYPHSKYTLSFSGRPGGPEFYINVDDNREIHGPGGQQAQNNVGEEAGPCFARVVEGFDVIDWMHKRNFSVMKDKKSLFTRIKSVRIIAEH